MHKQIWLPILIYSADVLTEEDNMVRADGFFPEWHSAFIGSEVAFFIIAAQAGSDEILPGVFAAPGFRVDMIDGESGPRSAILALMPIAAQNIFTRENYFLERHMNKMRKLDDTREIHVCLCRADHLAFGNAHHISLTHEN